MTRRKAGSGGITPLPSGHFRVRIRAAGRIVASGTYPTREEAESARRGALAMLTEAGDAPTGSLTLGQWGAAWLDEREREGFRSITEERSLWSNRVATATIATIPLRALTRQHVRDWLDETRKIPVRRRSKTGRVIVTGDMLRISSVRRLRAVVRSCLSSAVERGMIPSNPAGGFAIRAPSAGPRWTYLSREEVAAIVSHDLIPAPFRWLYTVAIYTGMRRGEMWALRWRDVELDGDRPQAHVRGSHAGPTKTGRERIVPLLPRAVDALRKWRKATRWDEPDDFVFATATGARRGKNDRGMWGRNGTHPGYRVVSGIERACSFHAFRHTCASALLQGYWGEPWRIEDVSMMLGHSSLAVTARYAHLSSEYLHRRARDLRDGDTASNGEIPAAVGGELRHSSITTHGDRMQQHRKQPADRPRVPDVSLTLAQALAEGVRDGIAVGDTIRALLASVAGVAELAPMVAACEGRHMVRRALDLADAVEALAARDMKPEKAHTP